VIVKSGDDCRQELMAVQIVSKLQAVFSDAGLPLWLRPFEVRTFAVTTPEAALNVYVSGIDHHVACCFDRGHHGRTFDPRAQVAPASRKQSSRLFQAALWYVSDTCTTVQL
jgi:hypothetical protein